MISVLDFLISSSESKTFYKLNFSSTVCRFSIRSKLNNVTSYV